MEKINEKIEWSDVELLEDGMILTGGEEGTANEQAKALANRTAWLNENKAGEVNGKIVREGKVAIEGKDILVQSGRTVQAELDQKSDTNHTHEELGNGNIYYGGSGGVPAGTVIAWAGATAPIGYMECKGQSLKRADYAKLFQAIGTTWGSDSVDTFKLPDFYSAARFLRSRGDGLDVGDVQEDAIRNITGGLPTGNGRALIGHANITIGEQKGAIKITDVGETLAGNINGGKYAFFDFDASRVVPTADENRPKSAVVMYCIKSENEKGESQAETVTDLIDEINQLKEEMVYPLGYIYGFTVAWVSSTEIRIFDGCCRSEYGKCNIHHTNLSGHILKIDNMDINKWGSCHIYVVKKDDDTITFKSSPHALLTGLAEGEKGIRRIFTLVWKEGAGLIRFRSFLQNNRSTIQFFYLDNISIFNWNQKGNIDSKVYLTVPVGINCSSYGEIFIEPKVNDVWTWLRLYYPGNRNSSIVDGINTWATGNWKTNYEVSHNRWIENDHVVDIVCNAQPDKQYRVELKCKGYIDWRD